MAWSVTDGLERSAVREHTGSGGSLSANGRERAKSLCEAARVEAARRDGTHKGENESEESKDDSGAHTGDDGGHDVWGGED